jgi:hypothetical protein
MDECPHEHFDTVETFFERHKVCRQCAAEWDHETLTRPGQSPRLPWPTPEGGPPHGRDKDP